MLKWLMVCIVFHLMIGVLGMEDGNSHPLHFKSNIVETERMKMVSVKGVDDQRPLVSEPNLQDTGHAKNCGLASHNFSLTWVPKIVNPARGVIFHLHMIAPSNLMLGMINLAVYAGSSKKPFLTYGMPFSCPGAKKKFPHLKCPIKKGDPIHLSYSESDLTILPPGSYQLKAELTTRKQDFICARLCVIIRE